MDGNIQFSHILEPVQNVVHLVDTTSFGFLHCSFCMGSSLLDLLRLQLDGLAVNENPFALVRLRLPPLADLCRKVL